jgi:hypothetical protein
MLQRDHGVVVTLLIHRRWDIYERRKPWVAGQLIAKTSNETKNVEKYFARIATQSCAAYSTGLRKTYMPEWEASSVSPPDILPTFLGFPVLKDVPARYRDIENR